METKNVKSLGKMVGVLDCFSTTERSLSVSEIAERTGLPRSTAHRSILALKEVGFLEQERSRDQYRLGMRLFQLGATVLNNLDLQRKARPFCETLNSLTSESVHLCVFDGERMVFVERATGGPTGDQNDTIVMEISPCYCTGVGKATLAFQPQPIIDRVIAAGQDRFTAHTLVEPEALRRELEEIRACGYALDREEHKLNVRCVAAPIRNSAGRVIASVSSSGPAKRMSEERQHELAPYVVSHAEAISKQLGWVPPEQA
ncbi:IclR family transcriptional regulator [Salipiger mucosus]|uniref:Transcriptional regulator, IclR family n=1 Tax=Salipiger mucosus DSM 16094 TaxID=1123237 RepID=S9R089_9RHOB|nr:IclR family transcriptional regulator [Salipiger mucosus]EPX85277.1 transcriptional regulator, IclR family [Salipiger mucosus DSM 16094]